MTVQAPACRYARAPALVLAALVAVAGCSGSSTLTSRKTKTRPKNDDNHGSAPDRLREVEATVLENYRLFASGASASYAQGIARDRPVAIAGITPNTVLVGTWPDGIEKDRRPYQAKSVRIFSKNLDVHLAQNPSVAWVSDELSYRVPYKGREASVPIRFTGVYVRDIDRWLLVMEHMSYALPATDLVDKIKGNELSILPPLPKDDLPADDKSETLKDRIKIKRVLDRLHSARAPLSDSVATDTDVLIMWPESDAEYRGLAASAAPKLIEMFGSNARIVDSQYRLFIGGSNAIAWAIANHRVQLPAGRTVDLRATYVLEKRGYASNKWLIVQAHVAVPLRIRQIDRRVFGIRSR